MRCISPLAELYNLKYKSQTKQSSIYYNVMTNTLFKSVEGIKKKYFHKSFVLSSSRYKYMVGTFHIIRNKENQNSSKNNKKKYFDS